MIEPKWARFTFPTTWHYDVLRGLDYLRSAGGKPDERVAEAVRLVAERRQPDGRWLLDEPHRDAVYDDLEGGAGQPVEPKPCRSSIIRASFAPRQADSSGRSGKNTQLFATPLFSGYHV